MIPDPNTAEGQAEIERRLARRRSEAESVRERALRNVDSESRGKLTNPSEIDVRLDRKNGDE